MISLRLAPNCARNIGGVTQSRRETFITIFAAPMENSMSADDLHFLEEQLEVPYGRGDGGSTWHPS